MTARLNPYPAYKESGASWLGDVPAHWDTHKLRGVLTSVTARNLPDLPLLSVVREKGVILRDVTSKDSNHNYIPDDLSNYKVVRKGQFAMNKMKAWQGSFGVSQNDGIVSPAYFVFEIRGVEGTFLHRAIRSKAYVPFFTQASDGVRIGQWDLSQSRMREIPFLVPPLPEQHAIVRYLDYMDRRINRYIRAKRKLVTLLEEQKQAIIHHAVTRGLDPDVALRPSGVEWLGDIPAHWEVKRIKYLLQEVDERSTTGEETLLSLRMNLGVVPHDDHFTRPGQAPTLVGYKRVYPGQVVMNRLQANNGLVFATDIHGVVSPDYAVFDAIGEISLDYLTTLFRIPVMKHKFRIESKGLGTGTAGFLRLYTDRFGMISVPLPSVDEQARIMATLNIRLSKLRNTTARVEREIDLLREYRTRLIADVVTGKLDVRAAAAALPEDDPDEALDDLPDDLDEIEVEPEEQETADVTD